CARGKQRGYDQDQGPSTHPVAGRVADSAAALQDFDGISYVKGASILKQLAARLGSETFERGIRAYLSEHRFGSVGMDDLLRALSRAGGNSLDEWAAAWLRTTGVDTLRPEARVSPAGDYESVAVLRTPPSRGTVDRPHRIAIGLYDRVGESLVRRDRLELDLIGARTDVPGLVGVAAPDLLLLNEDDLSWAKIRFDERSLGTVLDGGIARLDDSMARSLAWSATWHMTRDGELPASDFVRLVLEGLSKERDAGLMEQTLSWARLAIDAFSGPEARSRRPADLADRCLEATRTRADEPDVQLAAAQVFVSAVSGRAQVDLLKSWLDGERIPGGLAIDNDLRWRSFERLAILGQVSSERIAQEMEADRTFAGQVHGTEALASLPTAEAKAAAWSAVMEEHDLSNHMAGAMARGFWQHEHIALGRPYVERYFEMVPAVWRSRTLEMALMVARLMYPATVIESATIERTDAALAAPGLEPGLRRVLAEGRDDVRRALHCRQVDRSS
ncbi:MAG: M1 family metallopeptidase, partial [Chloroflexota bacterium]|nr:M1 family metallopeptidase [Chloroflexota bacterium]